MAENGGIGEKEQAEERRKDERDVVVIRQMWFMIGVGLSVFLGGFGIWTLDNKYCSTLRRWRHEIGLPWGILLEGHGWWHLMTGLGAYFYIVRVGPVYFTWRYADCTCRHGVSGSGIA